ncbi:hypothetical protein CW304_21990 [Bacillus sp. UFRGS-B20]|nr:hypothetical protein CW304_21990 [Bacillus sp. UFRGS-B20]
MCPIASTLHHLSRWSVSNNLGIACKFHLNLSLTVTCPKHTPSAFDQGGKEYDLLLIFDALPAHCFPHQY